MLAVAAVVVLATLVGVLARCAHLTRGRSVPPGHFVERVFADRFQRGNVHTHSLVSDGAAPIEAMVTWYRTHGYQFLAMTEHDTRVDPDTLVDLTGPGFVLIPGEEVTDRADGRPLHVNALCARRRVEGGRELPRADVGLATMFAQIRAEGGTPLVNHPNYRDSLTADDIVRGASGRYLLEVWSGHPDVATDGTGSRPSSETVWDRVLARGGDAIPAAVDDAHGLPEDPNARALPGRGWLETFGAETRADAICAALAEGRLYASNGPELSAIDVREDVLAVTTKDPAATATFLGEGGEVLAVVRAADVAATGDARVLSYRLVGGETRVRARISDAQGRYAWTAAYRVEPIAAAR
jgi:hypothetical protein